METFYQLEKLALAGCLVVPVLICFSIANVFKWTHKREVLRDAENPKPSAAENRQKFLGKVIRLGDLQALSEIKSEEKKKVPPTVNRLGGRKRWSSKKKILRKIHKE